MTDKYPRLIDRFQSTFVDAIFVVIVMICMFSLLEQFEDTPGWIRGTLFIILIIGYEPICVANGCTLGNYVKKIRVRQHADNTQKISFVKAILRQIIKLSLGWLSFITVFSNNERRAIHDELSGSVMIRV
ncbi:RDD family protein [Solitalea canadensis]|uniref:RDD domain-containing protein n=1 Tax=Solitalea canadensis (strain ATCC 29591 / DSM 3403 / JCM 21819 / LMG 8368 / NBRC 15130 / NCIMB 12057 / USAM 9D) TaxID=929556 RepID=H8KUS1_SOLCM|nr:RDD family protein [Solitalea canadensis]AFD07555.1 hypothetical protein Solca_2520 [Solitalea canadensis DSM 3403]